MTDKIREAIARVKNFRDRYKEWAEKDASNIYVKAIDTLISYAEEQEQTLPPINDGECYICKKTTNSLASNSSEWAIFLAHIDGQTKHRYYHVRCLYPS